MKPHHPRNIRVARSDLKIALNAYALRRRRKMLAIELRAKRGDSPLKCEDEPRTPRDSSRGWSRTQRQKRPIDPIGSRLPPEMSFQPQSSRQEMQNRKILEDLQKKQQLMKQQQTQPVSGATANPMATPSALDVNNGTIAGGAAGGQVQGQTSSQRERAALQHAHQNSFGFFITQDSSFGNLILPVLPRYPL